MDNNLLLPHIHSLQEIRRHGVGYRNGGHRNRLVSQSTTLVDHLLVMKFTD